MACSGCLGRPPTADRAHERHSATCRWCSRPPYWLDQLETALRGHFGKNYLPAGYLDLKDLVAAKLSLGFNLMLASLPDILIGTVTSAIIGLSAIVLSGFFLMRGSSVADSLYSLLPGSRQATARALGAEIAHVFGSYVSGQLALCGSPVP